MFKLLLETIRQGGGAALLDFVSPSFFDVVPVAKSTVLITRLMREALVPIPPDKKAYIQQSLSSKNVPVTLGLVKSKVPTRESPPIGSDRTSLEYGSTILKLYFSQVFCMSESILDLRHQAFLYEDKQLIWNPSNILHAWDPEFIKSMREIYLGFYTNDRNQFRKGLKEINLSTAEELFLAHFGEGDQTQVTFTINGFRKSFHDIFVHCKVQKIKLHVDFLPLGIL